MEIAIKQGFWTINETQIKDLDLSEKLIFDKFLKSRKLQKPTQENSFKNNKEKTKLLNYIFNL